MDNEENYTKGVKNILIAIYFYLSNGLAILNEFRNLFLGIFAVYITLKLTDPMLMVYMTVVSIVILTITGYFVVHHVAKIKEWLTVKFGTHYGVKNFDYVKRQVELLEEINKKLNEKLDTKKTVRKRKRRVVS